MKVITFKSGRTVKISQEHLDMLREAVLESPDGKTDHVFFSKEDKTVLAIDMREVESIADAQ